jgi:hypothetical protein
MAPPFEHYGVQLWTPEVPPGRQESISKLRNPVSVAHACIRSGDGTLRLGRAGPTEPLTAVAAPLPLQPIANASRPSPKMTEDIHAIVFPSGPIFLQSPDWYGKAGFGSGPPECSLYAAAARPDQGLTLGGSRLAATTRPGWRGRTPAALGLQQLRLRPPEAARGVAPRSHATQPVPPVLVRCGGKRAAQQVQLTLMHPGNQLPAFHESRTPESA